MSKLSDYTSCVCGAECCYLGSNENEPCYGEVNAIEEVEFEDDYSWVHVCIGHQTTFDGGVLSHPR